MCVYVCVCARTPLWSSNLYCTEYLPILYLVRILIISLLPQHCLPPYKYSFILSPSQPWFFISPYLTLYLQLGTLSLPPVSCQLTHKSEGHPSILLSLAAGEEAAATTSADIFYVLFYSHLHPTVDCGLLGDLASERTSTHKHFLIPVFCKPVLRVHGAIWNCTLDSTIPNYLERLKGDACIYFICFCKRVFFFFSFLIYIFGLTAY